MTIPRPERGLVISYSYLWHEEAAAGREEGAKARPCAIVLAPESHDGDVVVTVVPVTHAPPGASTQAVEIPQVIKRDLGLDSERSWVVIDEVNRFVWPGPDLRTVPGSKNEFAYGLLPPRFFAKIIRSLIRLLRARGVSVTSR